MKRILCLLLAVAVLLICCGCKRQSTEDFAATDTVLDQPTEEVVGPSTDSVELPTESEESEQIEEPKSTEENSGSPFTEEQLEKINQQLNEQFNNPNYHDSDVRITFEYEDCADLPSVRAMEYTKYDIFYVSNSLPNYQIVMERLGEDGLIVVGSAFGQREGRLVDTFQPSTKTQFRIEKVFYGTAPSEITTVLEGYFPDFTDDNRPKMPCLCVSSRFSRLKNDEKVLLFLKKNPDEDGVYIPMYFMLPVADDYDEYSEEAQKQLLAYYRGDSSVYKESYAAPKRFPASDLSDAQLLEQLKDNVLLQAFVEHKVVVWPEGHVNYKGCAFPADVRIGLQECSRP